MNSRLQFFVKTDGDDVAVNPDDVAAVIPSLSNRAAVQIVLRHNPVVINVKGSVRTVADAINQSHL